MMAASETLRNHFSDLVTLISANPLGVAVKLYSKKIIEKANFDWVLSSGNTNTEKACHILNLVSNAAKLNPSAFDTFCTILESDGSTEEYAKLIRDDYQENLKVELESSQTNFRTKCQSCSPLQETFLDKLRSKLQALNDTKSGGDKDILESILKVAKAALQGYITQSQQTESTLEHVNKHLLDIHEERLITDPAVYQWAQQFAKSTISEDAADVSSPTYVSSPPTAEVTVTSPSEVEKPPLFSKCTLWHASICSLVVSTCNAGDYQSFFKNKELVCGHTFKEVSVSRLKQDRLLIATQDDSTFYFAFQSELTIAEWPKRFKSFQEGIEFQGKMMPVHFIVELLNRGGYRIVLTGFSFGGVLASYIATKVWKSPYITSRHLQENFVCITFAQPHITVPGLEEVVRERPEMLSTMHSIYYQEDLVPRLIKYLDKPCSTLMEPESVPGVRLKVKRQQKMPFQDPVTQQLFKCLDDLHIATAMKPIPDTSSAPRSAVVLKDNLKTLASSQSISRDKHQHHGSFYLLAVDVPSTGLQFKKLTSEQSLDQRSFLRTSEVDGILLTKHSMEVYTQKLFRGHLQKAPEYMIPPLPKVPPQLDIVKPTVTSLVLHDHGNELALALEGKDLWFCYQVTVGGVMIETPASKIDGGTSVKFSDEKERSNLNLSDGETVKVTTHSRFSKPSSFHVTTHKKVYHASVRQQQLARLTPSQLIELAYLSALLEQHPYSDYQALSHKVLVIRNFLKDVVQVVPLESITNAIAYGNAHVAAKCAQALGHVQPPKSQLMRDGLFRCIDRLGSGLSPDILSPSWNKLIGATDHTYERMKKSITRSEEELILHIKSRQGEILTRETLEWKDLKQKYNAVPEPKLVSDSLKHQLGESQMAIADDIVNYGRSTAVICGLSIECLYPVSAATQESQMALESPMDILRKGKGKLAELTQQSANCGQNPKKLLTSQSSGNSSVMLQTVNCIRETDVAVCTSLLGGFMEQQEIGIPLMKSKKDRSKALELSARASVGVWALSSLNLSEIQDILERSHGQQLLVRIENYIKGIVYSKAMSPSPDDDQYSAKLQFIIQGARKTVTCNSQYISYSLERQLVELCNERNITASFPLVTLKEQWDLLFKENILSLVAKTHRPLLARWLKWALMVNNLREELAKYTAVGVIGLVNSGKSRLVTSLFGVQIPSGTTEGKHTTVPFMYNLERAVEGLDVVDFPGVDDRDETISDLADLLLTLSQIVVFVVDYRKIRTESGKKWLDRLQVEKVPVLVCLTFADKLYAEHMSEDGKDPDKKFMKHELESQLSMITEKLQLPSSFQIKFFSFSQDRDSVLNCKEGREKLRGVGIGTHLDVGEWLVETFKERFGQDDLTERLHEFIHSDY